MTTIDEVLNSPELLEIGRKAVEDTLRTVREVGGWVPPAGRHDYRRVLSRSHAVNSERLRAAELTADAADTALVEAEVAYLLASGYERIAGLETADHWRLGKRTFFWREKAVHSQKHSDEFYLKYPGLR